jgi:hypothetical protein
VAVLNPSLIPEQLDVVIGDHYFEMDFEVERVGIDENGEEVEFDWHTGCEGEGREGSLEDGQAGQEEGPKREPKKLKRDVDGTGLRGWLRTPRVLGMLYYHGRSRFRTCQRRSSEPF